MTDHIAAIERELDELEADDVDIPTSLRRLAELVDDVDRLAARYVRTRARLIRRARTIELTWREIGEIFGVSAQRAEAMSKQGTQERTNA